MGARTRYGQGAKARGPGARVGSAGAARVRLSGRLRGPRGTPCGVNSSLHICTGMYLSYQLSNNYYLIKDNKDFLIFKYYFNRVVIT